MSTRPAPILTLEPLIDAIREGVEGGAWSLSGLQKTTSHQFEGLWEGESSRSAYLFFHSDLAPEPASVEAFLDETNRGLFASLSLVVDGRTLEELGAVDPVLERLGGIASAHLPARYPAPLTLRLRLGNPAGPPGAAESEARFKLRLPRAALGNGHAEVVAVVRRAVRAFDSMLADPGLQGFFTDD